MDYQPNMPFFGPGNGDDYEPFTFTGQMNPHGYQPKDKIVEPFEAPDEAYDDDKDESDEQEEQELVRKLDEQWREAKTWWEPVHQHGRKCHEYYNNKQWTQKQINERKIAGMPALIMNKIAKAIDNITGRERSTRYDWRAAPIGADEVLAADAMTHGLKHIAIETNAKYAISDAFENAAIGPLGILEVYYDDSNPDQDSIHVDTVPWEEWFGDPFSRRRDQHDARYNIRARVLDLDIAKAAWPEKAKDLEASVQMYSLQEKQPVLSDYDNIDDGRPYVGRLGLVDEDPYARPRVLVREHQYWVLEHAEWFRMPDGKIVMADDLHSPIEMAMVQQSGGEYMKGLKRCYYIATVANTVLLDYRKSPYPYDRFSYVPLWCKRDSENKPYGLVSLMIDAQNEINVNLSRANEAIRSRHILYQPGALGTTTADQAAQAIARSNFVLEVADINGVKIGTDAADAALYIDLMNRAEQFLDDIVGANETAYGNPDNTAVSGKAKQLQLMQQGLTLGKLFDNLKFARQYVGEMLVALMQRYYTPEMLYRIIHANIMNQAGVGINSMGQPKSAMPDTSWLNAAFGGNIMQLKFDVVIEDTAESSTMRQAEMQQRVDLMGVVPDQLKGPLLPGLLRASDWSGAEEMANQVERQMAAMGMVPGQQQPQGMPPQQSPGQSPGQSPPQVPYTPSPDNGGMPM